MQPNFCDQLGKPRNIAELTKERLRRAGKTDSEKRIPLFKGADRWFPSPKAGLQQHTGVGTKPR
jgi:hypothetical protein